VKQYTESNTAVDEYLADQLLLPLALGQGGEFTAQCISEHTRTQAAMIEKFIDCEIEFVELSPDHFHVKVNV
jgi:RNA 3'-terminal phosphate cyclase (ATP)